MTEGCSYSRPFIGEIERIIDRELGNARLLKAREIGEERNRLREENDALKGVNAKLRAQVDELKQVNDNLQRRLDDFKGAVDRYRAEGV